MRIGLLLLICFSLTTAFEDFFDNELLRECRPIERQLDILFILDGSGSVSGNTFDTQLDMLHRIIEMVDISPEMTQIAVMQYASFTRLEFPFNAYQNKTSLLDGLQKIHHMSGTTKTGRAMEKALNVFQMDKTSGARRSMSVAQVAVVVSDGHSHDDPIPAAVRLREAGIILMTLGIGYHINRGELVQMTGDETLAFSDVQTQSSLANFTHRFKSLSKGERCDYTRGPSGAEVTCRSDSITIGISTQQRFKGHLFIEGHFSDPDCVTTSQGNELELTISLDRCGLRAKFMSNPTGILFETRVSLKYHPHFSTGKDRNFDVKCVYADKQGKVKKRLSFLMMDEEKDARFNIGTECDYRIAKKGSSDCPFQIMIGDQMEHRWNCDSKLFDTYQSMLIHSCHIVDHLNKQTREIIDVNGCSTDPSIVSTPEYPSPLSAFSIGQSVKFPDMPLVKARCLVKFCNRLSGDCEKILPPKCGNRFKRSPELDMSPEFSFDHPVQSHEMAVPHMATMRIPSFVTYREAVRRRLTTELPEVSSTESVRDSVEFMDITMTSQEVPTNTDIPLTVFPLISDNILSNLPTRNPNAQNSEGRGGVNVELRAQSVAIVRDGHFKEKFQQALKVRSRDSSEDVGSSRGSISAIRPLNESPPSDVKEPEMNTIAREVEEDVVTFETQQPLESKETTTDPISSTLITALGSPVEASTLAIPKEKNPLRVHLNRRGQIVSSGIRALFNENPATEIPKSVPSTQRVIMAKVEHLNDPFQDQEGTDVISDNESQRKNDAGEMSEPIPQNDIRATIVTGPVLSDALDTFVFDSDLVVESQTIMVRTPGAPKEHGCRKL